MAPSRTRKHAMHLVVHRLLVEIDRLWNPSMITNGKSAKVSRGYSNCLTLSKWQPWYIFFLMRSMIHPLRDEIHDPSPFWWDAWSILLMRSIHLFLVCEKWNLMPRFLNLQQTTRSKKGRRHKPGKSMILKLCKNGARVVHWEGAFSVTRICKPVYAIFWLFLVLTHNKIIY